MPKGNHLLERRPCKGSTMGDGFEKPAMSAHDRAICYLGWTARDKDGVLQKCMLVVEDYARRSQVLSQLQRKAFKHFPILRNCRVHQSKKIIQRRVASLHDSWWCWWVLGSRGGLGAARATLGRCWAVIGAQNHGCPNPLPFLPLPSG